MTGLKTTFTFILSDKLMPRQTNKTASRSTKSVNAPRPARHPRPMTPKAGVTKTRRRLAKGGKCE